MREYNVVMENKVAWLALAIGIIALVIASVAYEKSHRDDVTITGDLVVKGHTHLRQNNVAPSMYRWGSFDAVTPMPHFNVQSTEH